MKTHGQRWCIVKGLPLIWGYQSRGPMAQSRVRISVPWWKELSYGTPKRPGEDIYQNPLIFTSYQPGGGQEATFDVHVADSSRQFLLEAKWSAFRVKQRLIKASSCFIYKYTVYIWLFLLNRPSWCWWTTHLMPLNTRLFIVIWSSLERKKGNRLQRFPVCFEICDRRCFHQ